MHLREMDANLLVVLDVLLIETSVTKAAERLGRSPSAVSHALANLRHIFDDELFVRAGQRLAPTAKALEIAPTVHVIISGMESLLRPTNPFDPSTESRNFVIVGLEPYEFRLYDLIKAELDNNAPGIEVTWINAAQADILDGLRRGDFHFVIADGEIEAGKNEFLWNPIYDDALVTIARKSHPLLTSTNPTFDGWSHSVACPNIETSKACSSIVRLLEEKGAKITKTTSPLGAIFRATEQDMLVTAPRSIVEEPAKKLGLVPIPQPFSPVSMRINLGWHRSHNQDECHQWVRKSIIKLASASSGN